MAKTDLKKKVKPLVIPTTKEEKKKAKVEPSNLSIGER